MVEKAFRNEAHMWHPRAHKQQLLQDKPISRVCKLLPPAGRALIFYVVIQIFSKLLSVFHVLKTYQWKRSNMEGGNRRPLQSNDRSAWNNYLMGCIWDVWICIKPTTLESSISCTSLGASGWVYNGMQRCYMRFAGGAGGFLAAGGTVPTLECEPGGSIKRMKGPWRGSQVGVAPLWLEMWVLRCG